MPRPETSVAMATCEGGRYLEAQLASIAAQTHLPDELVICDDASADDSVERAERFAASAPFAVRIERNPERLGTTANFERAVSLCAGDVILLADQDDHWLPDKISTLLAALAAHPEHGLVFSNGLVMDEDLHPLGYDLWQALFFDATEQARVRAGRGVEVFARHVVAAGTTLAFRGRYLPLLLPFPDLPSTHDAWIAFMITAVAGCGLVERPLIHYRLHSANQIGLQRLGWLAQYRRARRQLEEDAFGRAAAFFELARERLAAGGPEFRASAETLAVIDQKVAHCRIRESMPDSLPRRLPAIAGELLRGRYRRFSYGMKSVAQDLLMR